MARLFISQEQMDRWTSAGRVQLADDLLTLPAMGRAFRLRSAVYFLSTVSGPDEHQLLGRVKTDEQLAVLKAEQYGRSVIVGEVGYECEEGFVGVAAEGGAIGGTSGLLRLGN